MALAVLAIIAIGFMCYMFFQVQSFYPEDYAHRAQEIRAQADSVRAETERLSQELRTQEEAMEGNLSLIGSDGAALQEKLDELRGANEEKSERLPALEEELTRAENMEEEVLSFRREYSSAGPRLSGDPRPA